MASANKNNPMYYFMVVSCLIGLAILYWGTAGSGTKLEPWHAVSSSAVVSRSAAGVMLYGCGFDRVVGSGLVKNTNESEVVLRRVLQDRTREAEKTQAIDVLAPGAELPLATISARNAFYVTRNGVEVGFFTGACPES